MTTATITSEDEGFSLKRAFYSAVNAVTNTIKMAGSLAYDFIKANPLVTALGADLLLNGGNLTQKAITAGVKTIGGAIGDVGVSAGRGLWGMAFGD